MLDSLLVDFVACQSERRKENRENVIEIEKVQDQLDS